MRKYRGFRNEGLGEHLPGGFYRAHITAAPTSAPVPVGYAKPSPEFVPLPTSIPYYDPTTRYTREQILAMIDARTAAEHEVTFSQNSEGGDGIAEELEHIANEQAATDKAVNDGAGGTGLPLKIGAAKGKTNIVPLAVLGLLAYLFF